MEQRVGNYTVLRELARGGMGVVYVARQDGLAREVALKLHLGAAAGGAGDSTKEARARERFDREAKAVARLRHPHVIQVHEFGHHRGVPYLVMDLIVGESLEERLEREGALEPSEALRLLAPVTEAVAFAHSQGILHRDIKPGNILISREGHPFLTDFGLAKDLSDERDRLTRSGQLLGTPYYMAPEAASGATSEIDARTDVYALGAVLFQALTGEPAFVGDSLIELLRSIVSDPPTPPSHVQPQVPPELDAVVLQCLEKDPQRRYADAGELAADLARFAQGEPVSASRSSLSRGLRRISASRAWLLIPLLVALAVLGFVVDRAWLAPARAADAALQAELEWQRAELRPTLYGLDPRRTLSVSPGDLQRRIDELDELPLSVDPGLRTEARAYLAAYLWLLERSRGRRSGNWPRGVARGRPDVAVRAVVSAADGDFAGAQRILATALPDTPELRATELGLQARYEPAHFLASGPDSGGFRQLKLALFPQALEAHYGLLLSEGLSSRQAGFNVQLAAGQASLARWGESGLSEARARLSQALSRSAPRYRALDRLDPALALERLDRLRETWLSLEGCSPPAPLVEALAESVSRSLDTALSDAGGEADAERAYEVDNLYALITGRRLEAARFRHLVHLTVGKQGSWLVTVRLLYGVAHHDDELPRRALNWFGSMVEAYPALAAEARFLYPKDPLTRFLPLYEPEREVWPDAVESLASPFPGLNPRLLWVLREVAARRAHDSVQEGRWPRLRGLAVLEKLGAAMDRQGVPTPWHDYEWQRYEVTWLEANLRGDPESARVEFERHIETLRVSHQQGEVAASQLALALLHLAAVSGAELGPPLLEEALRLAPNLEREARAVQGGWTR